MAFNGHEDHSIDLETASALTKNYRDSLASTSSGDQTVAHFFGKEYLQTILGQEGCVGLRIYYALDDNGDKHLVISGVDSNENDLFEGALAQFARKSPPYSSSSNPLNS